MRILVCVLALVGFVSRAQEAEPLGGFAVTCAYVSTAGQLELAKNSKRCILKSGPSKSKDEQVVTYQRLKWDGRGQESRMVETASLVKKDGNFILTRAEGESAATAERFERTVVDGKGTLLRFTVMERDENKRGQEYALYDSKVCGNLKKLGNIGLATEMSDRCTELMSNAAHIIASTQNELEKENIKFGFQSHDGTIHPVPTKFFEGITEVFASCAIYGAAPKAGGYNILQYEESPKTRH
jgi:hypothetical protein